MQAINIIIPRKKHLSSWLFSAETVGGFIHRWLDDRVVHPVHLPPHLFPLWDFFLSSNQWFSNLRLASHFQHNKMQVKMRQMSSNKHFLICIKFTSIRLHQRSSFPKRQPTVDTEHFLSSVSKARHKGILLEKLQQKGIKLQFTWENHVHVREEVTLRLQRTSNIHIANWSKATFSVSCVSFTFFSVCAHSLQVSLTLIERSRKADPWNLQRNLWQAAMKLVG